jgi:hypothetical protein
LIIRSHVDRRLTVTSSVDIKANTVPSLLATANSAVPSGWFIASHEESHVPTTPTENTQTRKSS